MLKFSWSDLWWPCIWHIGSNTHLNLLWFNFNAFNFTCLGWIPKIFEKLSLGFTLNFRDFLKVGNSSEKMKIRFQAQKSNKKNHPEWYLQWTYRNLKYLRKCSSKIRMPSSFVHLRAPLCLHFIYTEVEIKKNGRFYTVPS